MLLYFHYNSHHHYYYHRFHYHWQMHFYRLRMLLTIPLVCNMIPCLLQLHFVYILSFFFWYLFFSSVIPRFWFLRPAKGLRITLRRNLDVLLILIFIFVVIYASLFTLLAYTYLHLLMDAYVFFIQLYELDKIVKIWGI